MKFINWILIFILFSSLENNNKAQDSCPCDFSKGVPIQENPNYYAELESLKIELTTQIRQKTNIKGKLKIEFVVSCTGKTCRFKSEYVDHSKIIATSNREILTDIFQSLPNLTPATDTTGTPVDTGTSIELEI